MNLELTCSDGRPFVLEANPRAALMASASTAVEGYRRALRAAGRARVMQAGNAVARERRKRAALLPRSACACGDVRTSTPPKKEVRRAHSLPRQTDGPMQPSRRQSR